MKPLRSGKKVPAAVSRLPSAGLYGIGVDILRQERMAKVFARHGSRLVKKILCAAEQRELRRRRARPERFLAMAFAAKEAFVKALGTGFRGVGYRDAGVVHEKSGRPVLVFSRRLRAELTRRGIAGGQVSLSDEGGLVCAFVVLERRP
jgi:holo-[acyl-carrier protein] synthase